MEEYKDTLFMNVYLNNEEPKEPKESKKPKEPKEERTNTLRLTQEFNEKLFKYVRKSIQITPLSIMKDDIKNYRPLTDIQLTQLEEFTEAEKIEIIKTFNTMFASIESLLH
jgi:hypothetical protein